MIDYGDFQFACPPLCGEEWIVKAVAAAGLKEAPKEYAAIPFNKKRTKLRVSLVRHPCRWLYLCFLAKRNNKLNFNWVREVCEFDDSSFENFIQDFLYCGDGVIERVYDQYEADTVMKIEGQPWAMIEFLESFGIPPGDRRRLWNKPPVKAPVGKWDIPLRRAVLQKERSLCERYDYY